MGRPKLANFGSEQWMLEPEGINLDCYLFLQMSMKVIFEVIKEIRSEKELG
tara:strand:- start:187 stop:339 length:153 start_codon:yes stop_codon:yes gene_type:complete